MPRDAPNLTPENWEAAWLVLSGQVGERPAKHEAAIAAGVTVKELNAWIARSREKRPEDEPFVHEIAERYDTLNQARAEFLEGVAWERAVYGVVTPVIFRGEVMPDTIRKVDNTLLMRLLERYNPVFREAKTALLKDGAGSDEKPEDLVMRVLAKLRMDQIEKMKQARGLPQPPVIIEGAASAPEEVPMPAQPNQDPHHNLDMPETL